MRKCPLSYKEVDDRYDLQALKRINHRLSDLEDLAYTTEELLHEVAARAGKLSIQGVQPKLSARLNLKRHSFELVNTQGQYIIKPPSLHYKNLPENEDCTMKAAKTVGLETPLHGLIYGKDGQRSYWVKRFDRGAKGQKFSLEDFAQLAGASRKTKYGYSLEQVAQLVETYCTFPRVESRKLFKLLLFCFLSGNEDQHLKNFSILVKNTLTQLSPCYDLVNSTIVLTNPREESALTLAGKKSKLKLSDFLDYARTRLKLTAPIIGEVFQELAEGLVHWPALIRSSFLPDASIGNYLLLFEKRYRRLGFVLLELDLEALNLLSRANFTKSSREDQTFSHQLERQRAGNLQCLTSEQIETVRIREQEPGATYGMLSLLTADWKPPP